MRLFLFPPLFCLPWAIQGQVVTDGSFGEVKALGGPGYIVESELGKTVGVNLFHSFLEFSIQKDEVVLFTGPNSIENILGRVTGDKISNIDGEIISEIEGASLFLLNPNGFLFGKNAKIDVKGSAVFSAADHLKLGDAGRFDAVNPDQSVFVSASPTSFGFLGTNPLGDITISGSKLRVWGAENALALKANQIKLKSMGRTEGLEGGAIHLEGKSIVMNGYSEINTHARSEIDSGGIKMIGQSIEISERSRLKTSHQGDGNAGDISLVSEGDIRIGDVAFSGSMIESNAEGIGQSGMISIEAKNISIDGSGTAINSNSSEGTQGGRAGEIKASAQETLKIHNGASIGSGTSGYSNAGSIVLNAKNISIGGGYNKLTETVIATDSEGTTSNSGNAGEILVEAVEAVKIGSWAALSSSTDGTGDAGAITIRGGSITMDGDAENAVVKTVSTGGRGKGGNIILESLGEIKVVNGGQITASTDGEGDAGAIIIKATGLEIGLSEEAESGADERGSGIASITTGESDAGNGGKINIEVDQLNVRTLGRIDSSTLGAGDGGGIQIQSNAITIEGDYSIIKASSLGKGKGGDLILKTGDLSVSNLGEIQSSSSGIGDGGYISIDAAGTIELKEGASLSVASEISNGGQIDINVGELFSLDDASLLTNAKQDGGDIIIQTGGQVLVDNSEFSASAKLNGGNVRLYGSSAFLTIDGRITAEAGQDGGNIFVEAPETFLLQRSRLSANAVYGHGGYILIVSEGFLPSIKTAVTASSEFGVQGTVEIRTPNSDVGSGLVVLPSTIVTEKINLAERCTMQLQSRDKSSFVKWGYGGVPSLADQLYLPTARFRFSALSGYDEDE